MLGCAARGADSHTKSLIAAHKAFYNAQMAAELHTLVSFSFSLSQALYTFCCGTTTRGISQRRSETRIYYYDDLYTMRPPRVIIVIMLHKACIKINIEKAMIMCSPWRYLFYNALQLCLCVCVLCLKDKLQTSAACAWLSQERRIYKCTHKKRARGGDDDDGFEGLLNWPHPQACH